MDALLQDGLAGGTVGHNTTLTLTLTLTAVIFQPVLSSERAPSQDKTVTVKQGLDTKTDRLTDRQSQCDSDSRNIPKRSVPNEESSRQPAMD
jgi:hypothetical protein